MLKRIISSIILTIIFGFGVFYFMLPPINLSSFEFYIYLIIVMGFFSLILSIPRKNEKLLPRYVIKINMSLITLFVGVFAFIFIFNIFLSPVFNSKSYAKRITVLEDSDFTEEIKEVDFTKIPLLDRDSSEKLGDRVMGQLGDLVSQFYVSNMYTQINYNDSILRVTPLEYNGFIKYLTNKKDGVAGYITVNSVNGEANLIKLEKGMNYVPSAYFSYDLYRKLRFNHPTEILDDINFEIDNEGNPFYVVPTIKYSGVGLKKEIKGVIILNAITGETKKYNINEVPSWVDHVYSPTLIIEQLHDWGVYKNGFLNSIFGQRNVVVTTEGYNYLTMEDDVYLYTGITSVLTDESNIGFILTNMRTKETKFYSVPGAEEYSAMASAEGQVQQMNYISTFPLLINLNNRPTYLISLKDNAGLVKMYAFVDVVDYQKVVVTDAAKGINEAARNYLTNIGGNYTKLNEKDIVVKSISSSIINGNTYYYILDSEGERYRVSINVDEYNLPFVTIGNILTITYVEGNVKEITNIK